MKKNFSRKKLDLNKQTIANLSKGEMIGIYGGSETREPPHDGDPPTLEPTCPTIPNKPLDTEPTV
jgi:hypothetical protein